jgi:hypothetical protein
MLLQFHHKVHEVTHTKKSLSKTAEWISVKFGIGGLH